MSVWLPAVGAGGLTTIGQSGRVAMVVELPKAGPGVEMSEKTILAIQGQWWQGWVWGMGSGVAVGGMCLMMILWTKQQKGGVRWFKQVLAAKLPVKGSRGAAGWDLFANQNIKVPAWGRVMVSTGVGVVMPDSMYGRVAPRSGLAWKHGLGVGAGVIDSDYRGEIKVVLYNHTTEGYDIHIGDRIAQLIFEQIYNTTVTEISKDSITTTERQ